jgi:hypothetical protein
MKHVLLGTTPAGQIDKNLRGCSNGYVDLQQNKSHVMLEAM